MKLLKNLFVLLVILLPFISLLIYSPRPPYISADWKFTGTPDGYPYKVWDPELNYQENSTTEVDTIHESTTKTQIHQDPGSKTDIQAEVKTQETGKNERETEVKEVVNIPLQETQNFDNSQILTEKKLTLAKVELEYKKYEKAQLIILSEELKKSRIEEIEKLKKQLNDYNLSQSDYDTYYKQGEAEILQELESYTKQTIAKLKAEIQEDKQKQIEEIKKSYDPYR